ncbi:LETM1-related biofilm-associated protein [Altibacter lentus]|uniref:LETM1-related biofilm-associated protein n=1 Tax=Altibacter lentus TaxID=1223410 RepID=UPI00054E4955|nr:LETM1-related biofilm-associated protein [Altibacter lentus]
MNPSATDWIPKLLNGFRPEDLLGSNKNEVDFYSDLKSVGFIFGVSVSSLLGKNVSSLQLTKEEYTKVNLFHALLTTYCYFNNTNNFSEAVPKIITFYQQLEKGKTGFFKKLTLSQTPTQELEHILSARLQETNTSLKKNNTSILTYALLYADVLAFMRWLDTPRAIKNYAKLLETLVISCCFLALKAKRKQTKYDRLLIELFESSSEYLIETASGTQVITLQNLSRLKKLNLLEKKYLLDICTIAVWDDHQMDLAEFKFLQDLIAFMQLSEDELTKSLKELSLFSEAYGSKIKLFEYSNPVRLFYKQSAATVKLLILRNKKRLQQELEESGELLVLLSQSTVRDLSEEERHKVKEQLLDVCKTIPSLTIFLLPGGTVLLPLLVKFIPKLLPSSFNENRIDPKKK